MKKLSTQELLQMLEHIRVRSGSERYRHALKQAEDTLRDLLTFDGKAKPTTGHKGTNITSEHKQWLDAIKSGAGNIALFSCFVDGQPASAIVAVVPDGDSFRITPLFVTINDHMHITDHEGVRPTNHDNEEAPHKDH